MVKARRFIPTLTLLEGRRLQATSVLFFPTPQVVVEPRSVTLGTKFSVAQDGLIRGVFVYHVPNQAITTVDLWSGSGSKLAETMVAPSLPTGWVEVDFAAPVAASAGASFVTSYTTHGPFIADTRNYDWTSSASAGDIQVSPNAGVYVYAASPTFPTYTYMSSNYWVSPIVDTA